MSTTEPMVIVGAGQCGARASQALRENGWDGAIALFGDEGLSPYERPPLSKSVLLGQKTTVQCTIYDEAFYREQRIDLRSDAPVTAIDRVGHRVVLASGDTLGYHRLLIATGARPRRLDLPGATLAGVHVLRGVRDAHAIGAELRPGCRIAVI
jgi:3-phenylpropionate/trans-cinnamate dioxygenase ferredoxin reductase subunit